MVTKSTIMIRYLEIGDGDLCVAKLGPLHERPVDEDVLAQGLDEEVALVAQVAHGVQH